MTVKDARGYHTVLTQTRALIYTVRIDQLPVRAIELVLLEIRKCRPYRYSDTFVSDIEYSRGYLLPMKLCFRLCFVC